MLIGILLLATAVPANGDDPHRIPANAIVKVNGTQPSGCWHRHPSTNEVEKALHTYILKNYIQIDGSEEYDFSECYLEGVAKYNGKTASFKLYDTNLIEIQFPDKETWWMVPPKRRHR